MSPEVAPRDQHIYIQLVLMPCPLTDSPPSRQHPDLVTDLVFRPEKQGHCCYTQGLQALVRSLRAYAEVRWLVFFEDQRSLRHNTSLLSSAVLSGSVVVACRTRLYQSVFAPLSEMPCDGAADGQSSWIGCRGLVPAIMWKTGLLTFIAGGVNLFRRSRCARRTFPRVVADRPPFEFSVCDRYSAPTVV